MTMKFNKLAIGLLLGTMMTTSALAQDVVMRRPIPMLKNGAGQDCAVTNTCPPDLPDESIVAYGYGLRCPISTDCYKATYIEADDDVIISPVDASFCQTAQTPEQAELLDWAGLTPGGPNFNADNVCNNPGTAYLWGGYCNGTEAVYYCGGFSENMQPILHPESACENYVPQPEHASVIATWAINGMVTNAQKIANPLNCSGNPDPEPDEDTGLEYDPDQDDGLEVELARGGTYSWEVGAWQGNATCGEVGTLNRVVRCVETRRSGPVFGPVGMGPHSEIFQVSFSDEYAERRTNAVYTGDEISPEKAILGSDEKANVLNVQTSANTTRHYIDPNVCVAEIGSPPPNRYTGTEANCDHELELENEGQWTAPSGQDPMCSDNATFTPQYRCVSSVTGQTLPLSICMANLNTGETSFDNIQATQVGNYSGCTAEWIRTPSGPSCHESIDLSSPNGPLKVVEAYGACVRSDGKILTGADESACDPAERPETIVYQAGTCYVNFTYQDWDGVCWGNLKSGWSRNIEDFVETRTSVFIGTMNQGGAALCAATNSICCQERYNVTDGVVETVGGSAPKDTFGKQIYNDDPAQILPDWGKVTVYPDGTVERDESTKFYYAEGAKRYHTVAASNIIYTIDPPAPID